ncbi:MAG: putative oxidoreductase [Acidimicrobiia bacterium]|nr:putative oxidoreductase [Acidimicrobiia bacterium]
MADLGFDGKVALITGAGGGLGRHHALLLAERGARVVVNDLGGAVDGTGASASPAQQVVEEITALGGEAIADPNSVATPEGGAAMVKTAVDSFGRIDIVVNNAGILRDKSFASLTPDLLNIVIDVHLKGAFHVTMAAWPHFREQSYGRVVNTSSASGIFGNFGQSNYGAAKMGLVGMTRVLAIEGAKYNILVNAIAPVARTRMTEEVLGAEFIEHVDPRNVSPMVAWLAHEECDAFGEIYSVGGGRVAQIFVGQTLGYTKPGITVEDVRDNIDEIRNRDGYEVPRTLADDLAMYERAFKSL